VPLEEEEIVMYASHEQSGKVFLLASILCTTCAMLGASSAGAMITSVQVEPANPTVNDSITITCSGWFNDTCWDPDEGHCGSVMGFVIKPWINAVDHWAPGIVCLMMVVPYSFQCEYGQLPAGHYVVNFTENHESMRDPVSDFLSVEFDVGLPQSIGATVDFDPNTLNLRSRGKCVTCYVELPQGYDPEDIDVGSIQFEYAVDALAAPTYVGDYDSDGIPDRMVKFARDEVISYLTGYDALYDDADGGSENLEVTISGQLTDGTMFVGTDTIRTKNPGAGHSEPQQLHVSPTAVVSKALISYELDASGYVSLRIYDATGRPVRTLVSGEEAAGTHNVLWDGMTDSGLRSAPGIYFVLWSADGRSEIRRIALVR
jgi:hypothetical protein